jgi:ABC-type multidrug transport system ATPase subunit
MSGPVVVVASASVRLGSAELLHDVSFTAGAGEVVVLRGRSGSGKTTLLHLLAGVSTPTSGTVEVLGRSAADRHDWSEVSLTPQHSTVAESLSVRENVLLPLSLRGLEAETPLLSSLGLEAAADQPASATSLGEQQRTCIARGLVLDPRVALLDEPTSHQDDDNVALVIAALRDAAARGTTVVVATHDARVVEVADVVIELASGRVVATG